MADQPALIAESVTKSFGRSVALRDVTLSVPTGCVYGFIGPNGSGKTTLIRVALDLLRPTSGRVSILGADSHRGGSAARRGVSYLPGNLALPPKSTGREFLSDLSALRGRRPDDGIADLAEMLAADLDRPIGHLSLGNRRKIGLIAAMSHEPRLLFLDEPTSGMDPLVQQTFRSLVRQAAARGATVFLSSHVLDEVQHVSDLVGVIRDGSVVTTGSVESLTQRLTRLFIATFDRSVTPADFGSIRNVVDISIGEHDQEIRFSVRGPSGPLFAALHRWQPVDVHGAEPDLEDVFIDLYRGKSDGVPS